MARKCANTQMKLANGMIQNQRWWCERSHRNFREENMSENELSVSHRREMMIGRNEWGVDKEEGWSFSTDP